jgi:hypothetical protein
MNTNTGFILRQKQTDPPLYWRALGPKIKDGRFLKDAKKAARFTTRKNAELFRACLSLQHESEVVPA